MTANGYGSFFCTLSPRKFAMNAKKEKLLLNDDEFIFPFLRYIPIPQFVSHFTSCLAVYYSKKQCKQTTADD
jgi:hypothetical protein